MSPGASPRWQSWWEERGKRELATLLLERWDAFDLRVIVGNRLDEYESEAEQVGQVLQRGPSADDVAEGLDAIVRGNDPAMGNTVSAETPGVQALAAESMMRRLGFTHAEAIRRLEFQDATTGEVGDKIHDLLGDRDGDMWFDHDDGGRLKFGVVRRDGGMESSAVDEVRHLLGAYGLSDGSDLVPVDHSTQELDDAHPPITAQLSDLYRAGKIASGRNPSLNALLIHMATVTGADRARLQRVADQAPVRVVLRQTQCPTMFAVEE